MRWYPSAENATVFCWKHCSMPIIVVCFMDQEFWQIFSQNIWCYRIKKKMKLMGKMKTKAWFQVLIFESIFTHGRETSRHMRLLFDDHFLYGSDESEKKIYRAIYLPCSMYARIIWGAQCQVKSPKLPFYCFISFEMAFYLLSPCVKNFFKGALILNVWLLNFFKGKIDIFSLFIHWISLNMRCIVF